MEDTMKTVAIIQSNYIPWKGYFDIIGLADVFVVYDEVQYTKNDWRNRNLIKTSTGSTWLTIPVVQRELNQRISETKVASGNWKRKHWSAIQHSYSKAKCYAEYGPKIQALYQSATMEHLSEINYHFILGINSLLGIQTPIVRSSELALQGDRNQKLMQAVRELGGTHYLSGQAAAAYLDEQAFSKQGIKIEWMDYSNYPEYGQLHGTFTHQVSILDLLLNEGSASKNYMKCTERK
jgi:hypothetical protein